jgi:hypothetical protein
MKIRFLLAGLFACAGISAQAADSLTESTFTEIIKQANVVAATDKSVTPAQVNEVFRVPDLVRTGPESRLEMTAPDKTITRVGENSVFTFEPGERNIRLQQGSVLFHPPAGVGGGTVKYGGTAAAVLGTTIICAVMPDGSFKIMLLEGKAIVTLANGKTMELGAGQMLIVPPSGDSFSPVKDIDLAKLVPHLLLISGFSNPLSSMPLIEDAIRLQNEQIAEGKEFHFDSLATIGFGLDLIFDRFPDISILLNALDLTIIPISPTSGSQ